MCIVLFDVLSFTLIGGMSLMLLIRVKFTGLIVSVQS